MIRGKKKTSIKDIAQETQLSNSTVSRVINGKAKEYRIGEKTQKLILDAAKKMNYKANYAAVSLKSGRSKTIALLVPSLSNPFFASMASEIIKDLRAEGYITILSESSENLENEKEILENLFKRNIDGLVIVPSGDQYQHLIDLKKEGLAIICIDRYFEDVALPYVSTDNFAGAYDASKYLIEGGHKRISVIQGIKKSVPNKQRILGFTAAMKEANLPIHITGNDFSIQNGYLETKLLLQQNTKPTAIFAFSNTIALGCLKALREDNIRIPEDISLITFDDHPYLEFLSTPLSCVVQPEVDIAKMALKFLFALMENKPMENQNVLLKPEIKIRSSVKSIIT